MLITMMAISSVMLSQEPGPVFTASDFAQLKFLVGRWKGTAPNGKDFYEEYDFPDATTFRSRRFPDDQFTKSTDSSTVKLEKGVITSQWGEYSWKATEVKAGKISFAPVKAPSSFSWEKVDDTTVQVVQRFKDKDGKDQSYTVTLKLIK